MTPSVSRIVSLHAHPDDEALLTGGWLAQRAAAGDRVVLIFATDGAAGLTGNGRDATGPDAVATLARRRRTEAAASARALGVDRLVWLCYADSGMSATPSGTTNRFADAPVEEVARRVAAVLDEEGADIMTGYDANGGYGHPDHIQVHRVARRAQQLCRRRPQLLEATLDRTLLIRVLRVLRPIARLLPGMTLPGDDIYTSRAEVTRVVDVRGQLAAKRAALAAHDTQTRGGVRTLRVLLALPRPLARRVLGTEWFVAVD